MARGKAKAASPNPLFNHARAGSDCRERDQPLHRSDITAHCATPLRPRVAEALSATRSVRVCAVCDREAGGFYYTHQHRPDRFPTFALCSHRCQRAGAVIAKRNLGMIDKTAMEARAIKDARRPLAEVLTELGLMTPFHDRKAEEITTEAVETVALQLLAKGGKAVGISGHQAISIGVATGDWVINARKAQCSTFARLTSRSSVMVVRNVRQRAA